jgi:hypothetical protein
MKMGSFNQFLLLIFLTQLFVSCVGKIEEAAAPVTTEFNRPKTFFNYKGIIRASAISHNKIELLFTKVEVDPLTESQEDYYYKLYVNDDQNGLEIIPSTLTSNLGGSYYYIVDNLQMNTIYAFTVRAFNRKTGAESKKEERVLLRTMSNTVSDFLGISKVDLTPGSESTSVRVTFNRIAQPVDKNNPYSPVRVELYYSENPSELMNLTSPQLTLPSTPGSELPSNYQTNFTVQGLTPNTTYYFRVRAIHRIFAQNESQVYNPYDRERNTKYLSIKTVSSQVMANINDPREFKVQRANGILAYSQVQASWVPPTGNYKGYRLVYAKSSVANFENVLTQVSSKTGDFKDPAGFFGVLNIGPENRFKEIETLTPGESYYFQLFLCRDSLTNCPLVDSAGSTTAPAPRFDKVGPVKVEPVLAAFTGINKIISPRTMEEYNNKQIILEFAPPSLGIGWADTMRFFCFSGTSEVQLPTPNAVAGTCEGVYIPNTEVSPNPPFPQIPTEGAELATFRTLTLRGIQFSSTTPREYCFNATPVLNQYHFNNPNNKIYSESERREFRGCFYPEVRVPTIAEFAGLSTGTFNKTTRKTTLTWSSPSGGLFNRFVIFWKKKVKNTFFSFAQARSVYTANRSNPSYSTELAIGVSSDNIYGYKVITNPLLTSGEVSGLDFGEYEFGVLPLLLDGSETFWGQANSNIKTILVPVPSATFKSWTRIFAIGPSKSNVHHDNSQTEFMSEAIDEHGVPYRPEHLASSLNRDPPGVRLPNVGNTKSLTGPFDGALASGARAGSRDGIISLAWEEVDIESTFQSQFSSNQSDTESPTFSVRSRREYGYKVYRSEDNGFTWKDLTPEPQPDDEPSKFNLIYSRSFDYYNRANQIRCRNNSSGAVSTLVGQSCPAGSSIYGEVAKRMAFFTDYSVKQPTPGTPLKDRARIYWYRIEPYYNGKKVNLNNPKNAMVKVTLPPPNMALVHRWMANRAQCLEMGITEQNIKINEHYSCGFTGLGAVPKTSPFTPGQTKLDIGGDLLVDRFELGCNYTRGPKDFNDQNSLLTEEKPSSTDYTNDYAGCYKLDGTKDELPGMFGVPFDTNTNITPLISNSPSFLLIGDCLGESGRFQSDTTSTISLMKCSTEAATARRYTSSYPIFAPGFNQSMGSTANCATRYVLKRAGIRAADDTSGYFSPDFMTSGQLSSDNPFEWASANYAQAKPLSVFVNIHNRNLNSPTDIIYAEPIAGVQNEEIKILGNSTGHASNCAINLAAIYNDPQGGQTTFSRWANLSQFTSSSATYNYSVSKTPQEIAQGRTGSPAFYDSNVLSAPAEVSQNTTPIGRILTSNNADLPPLTSISPQLGKDLCNLYEIDIVFEKDDTINSLTAVSTGLKKRLLQRREFVASSLWPETYNKFDIDYLEGVTNPSTENFTSNELNEFSLKNKQCVHSPPSSSALNRWTALPRSLKSTSPISSGFDLVPTIGSRCQSRFGIQNLIGNAEEMNSDLLHCSFSRNYLRYGAVGEDGTEDGSPWYIDLDTFVGNGNSYVHIAQDLRIFPSTDPNGVGTPLRIISDFQPYSKYSDANSGYCSTVDNNPTYRENFDGFGETYLFSFSAFYNQMIKQLNSFLIPRSTVIQDPGAAFSYRDGAGYFLDFGDKHMAQSLRLENSLGFPWDFIWNETSYLIFRTDEYTPASRTMNVFFSSLMGLPLNCGKGFGILSEQCNHSPTLVEERTYVARSNAFAQDEVQEATGTYERIPDINDFYVGGSTVSNIGLSNVDATRSSANNESWERQYIYGIVLLDESISPTNFQLDRSDFGVTWDVIYKNTKDLGTTPIGLYGAKWSIPQTFEDDNKEGENLRFYSGGSMTSPARNETLQNGRFSLNINRDTPSKKRGVRCVVKINEVE